MRSEDAMSGGVTDEQRIAAWRDTYGRVAYDATRRIFDWVTWQPWEALAPQDSVFYGLLAEAVIAAWTGGQTGQGKDGG